jgi:CubicO group peptidase (beta-lactamase class C family)
MIKQVRQFAFLIWLFGFVFVSFSLKAQIEKTDAFYKAPIVAPWEVSTPEKEGMNSKILNKAFKKARVWGFYYSLIVVRNAKIVAEEYYNGRDRYAMDPLYSVTKSFTSAIVGIVIDRGFIKNVNQKLGDYFPDLLQSDPDSSKKQITIKQLLTMQSGFDSEKNIRKEIDSSPNYLQAILSSKLRFSPGTEFLYSTHGSHVLSGIITRATKQIMYDFAMETLFNPIGIEYVAWIHDQNDLTLGGAGIFLTPRDMARFGYLYIEKGRIGDRQIISEKWVLESTKNQRGFTTSWEEMTDVGYGYQWWTGKIQEYEIYFASGMGGQWILNIPELNMVIVSTMNGSTEKGNKQMESFISLLDLYIIPSVIIRE